MQKLHSLSLEGRVNELVFAGAPAPHLYSASSDGMVRAWDVRAATPSPSVTLQDASVAPEEIWSVSLGGANLLAAGTESAVVIWDLRKSATSLCRWEVHTEPVTQVRFAPGGASMALFSASVDGLICRLDCSQTEEDEAVVGVCNCESPITSLGIYQAGATLRAYCISSLETLSIWDLDANDRICLLDNIRSADAGGEDQSGVKASAEGADGGDVLDADYLIGCQWDELRQQLRLLTGEHNGTVRIATVEHFGASGAAAPNAPSAGYGLRLTQSLSNSSTAGHSADVRCFHWGGDRLVTGGEDGRICSWTEAEGPGEAAGGEGSKAEKKLKKKEKQGRRSTPY